MILWVIYYLLALVFSVLCYLTNWLVVPFANKHGELPSFLALWQTWDNSLDCSDSVEVAPKIFQYDWKKHYQEYKGTTPFLQSINRKRWFSKCIDDHFTLIERIKRYFCRTLWLMRNNSYGFGFYLLGLNVSPNLEIKRSENTSFVREIYGNNLWGAWCYRNTAPIFTIGKWTVRWENLLGWKIKDSAEIVTRAMVAIRIAIRIETKKGDVKTQ